jgi:hypothetical protein
MIRGCFCFYIPHTHLILLLLLLFTSLNAPIYKVDCLIIIFTIVNKKNANFVNIQQGVSLETFKNVSLRVCFIGLKSNDKPSMRN